MTALASRHGISYRPGTADDHVLHEVFDRRVYALDLIPLKPPPTHPMIIDLGAHIGAASVWLAREWPTAWIVAVEPERQNHAVLLRNARGRPIMAALGAVMSKRQGYKVIDPDDGTWAYQVSPAAAFDTAMTVPDILGMAGDHTPLIVKIDIEGGEADLFAANTDWVDAIPVISIELHDWMIPGIGDTFRACVNARPDRVTFERHEITISVRKDWLCQEF